MLKSKCRFFRLMCFLMTENYLRWFLHVLWILMGGTKHTKTSTRGTGQQQNTKQHKKSYTRTVWKVSVRWTLPCGEYWRETRIIFLLRFIAQQRWPPTWREICQNSNSSFSSACLSSEINIWSFYKTIFSPTQFPPFPSFPLYNLQ